MQSTSWETLGWKKHKLESRLLGEISITSDMQMTPPLMAESEEELKSLLMKGRGEWKSWLKGQHSENEDHGIWSHHFMGNRRGNSRNSVRLYFGGLQITAGGDCSLEIKRCLLLGRNLDSIFKSRDITSPTKVRLVKAIHVWMWELDYKESWTPKNWCFWTVVLEKKEISPGCSLWRLMLKLKLQ